jgi:excisionase family DNA binding protein
MQNYPEILTVAQVAEHLQICKKSVYKLVEEKKLIPFQVMNTFRFTKESVDKFLTMNQCEKIK